MKTIIYLILLFYLGLSQISLQAQIQVSVLNVPSEEERKQWMDQIYFYLKHYQINQPLMVILSFPRQFSPASILDHRLQGTVLQYPEAALTTFHILILRSINERQKQSVLAHEMIHVAQMLQGDLSIEQALSWKNHSYTNPNQIPYLQRPWELEALSGQKKLTRLYQDFVEKNPDTCLASEFNTLCTK